jgi:hypothetical protein
MKTRLITLAAALALLSGAGLGAQTAAGRTPVLISSDDECRVSVDGDDVGTVSAAGLMKIALVPGEHLFSATCTGSRKWKETVAVGQQQKIVSIPAAGPPAVPGAPAAKGLTACLLDQDAVGRWIVKAIAKGGPCDKAGVRPGAIVVSAGGRKMKDATPQDLEKLDEGPVGSTLEGELLDVDGNFQKVTIVRAQLPEVGSMTLLQADGKTVKDVAFDTTHPFASGGASSAVTPRIAAPAMAIPRTPQCLGTATPCSLRQEWNCALGSGCNAGGGQCQGVPIGQRYVYSCAGFANKFACQGVTGCSWQAACTGFAFPCQSLQGPACTLQPGCFLN